MSRLLILALPMLLLYFVFHTGLRGGFDPAAQKPAEEGLAAAVTPSLGAGEQAASSRSRLEEKRRLSLRRSLQSLASGQSALGNAGISQVALAPADHEKLVDQILAEIPARLVRDLPAEDQELLRSYVSRLTSPSANDQAWLCWGPGVSEEKVAAFHEAEKLTGLAGQGYALFANQFLNSGRWDRTATDGFTGNVQGLPVTVTWSIVADGTSAPNAEGRDPISSDFRSWMASIYGGSTTGAAEAQGWFSIFRDAFEAMGQTCGVNLVYEPSDDGSALNSFRTGQLGVRGDIRIAARSLDGTGGTLAFAFSPDNGDIVFDSSDLTFNNTSSSSLRLFNVIAHELGHSLGLAHVCPLDGTKLLEPFLTTSFRGPRFDEHQSLQRLYGDRLEPSAAGSSNDSAATATPLSLVQDEPLTFTRLSIDDNGDQDYFRFSALRGQNLSVTLRPGEGTYLEGGDTSTGCSAGSSFNSRAVHNLKIQVFSSDGVTQLTLTDEGARGEDEALSKFELENDGDYFVRVSGESVNAAQLYRADFLLGNTNRTARLRRVGSQVLAESGSVKNGRLDPGETVKLGIDVRNVGDLSTIGTLGVSVTGSANVVIFSSEISPALASGETGLIELVFGALGDCRDIVTLNLEVFDDSGTLLTLESEVQLGSVVMTTPLDEDFDNSPGLPTGWSSEESGGGDEWDLTSSRFASSLFSAFSGGVSDVAQAELRAPSFVFSGMAGTLSFEHSFDIETNFDGGVLEVSRNGGAWSDLITDPAVTVTGAYTHTIRNNFGSPIVGRGAWSGNSGGFITTSVELPPAWSGDLIRLRWLFAHDNSTRSNGWWIDNVKVTLESVDCEEHRPALNLALTSGELDENTPDQSALLAVSAELPLVEALQLTLELAGSAGLSDITGSLLATIPAGAQTGEISLSALPDDLDEGEETLTVSIPSGQANFTTGSDASEVLTIIDLFNFSDWLAQFSLSGASSGGDSDGDGLSEVMEYLLGTDPTSATSNQSLLLQQMGEGFLLPLTGLPTRGDASFGIEFSRDLDSWAPASFDLLDDGFFLTPVGDRGFFRLRFTLNQ